MLVLDKIVKKYGSLYAAKNVSLTLEDGQSLVLVGESGSGKTTAARTAAGMLAPDEGKILLDGRELAHTCRRRSFDDCARIQYIFQDPYSALDDGRTVRAALEETARICRRHRHPCLTAEEALSYVDQNLVFGIDRPVREFSGGQRQKICIARALMPFPQIIIADEATSMLDRQSGNDVFSLLGRIKREKGISILAILHDIDFSGGYWDRIAVMHRGEIVEERDFSRFPECAVHPYSRELLNAYEYFNGRIHV